MNPVIYIRLTRPRQWLKNLMIFFPPFLSGALFHPGLLAKGVVPFLSFCCASSGSYIVNDLVDCSRDGLHPTKRFRPLPSGEMSRSSALSLAVLLLSGALWSAMLVSKVFLSYVVVYLAVSLLYTFVLKNWPLMDIFSISLGFVFRLYGGGEAFRVEISDWLFLSVFLLAIFLSVGKRFSEQLSLGEDAILHRPALEEYPSGFLEGAMYMSGAAVIVTYAIFAITKPMLVYTVPFCMFGLLRFLMRIKAGKSGDPTDALVKDAPLLAVSVCWIFLVSWCVYQ
jgi:4-hydroxybenzoate polyprenyltransferase